MNISNKKTSAAVMAVLVFFIFIAGSAYLINKPCQKPLTYKIGYVDERLSLTTEEFAVAENIAAQL